MDQPREEISFNLANVKIESNQKSKVKQEPGDEGSTQQQQQRPDKCSICWIEPPMNAVKLDCGHIFCFLCIKSIANTAKKCALCRSEIATDFDFGELDLVGEARLPTGSDDGYFWFYQGRTGWWLYDAETSSELEEAHKNRKKRIEKLISGQVYVISLRNLKQYQKSDPSRARYICRETLDLENILGMAGIRNIKILEQMRPRREQDRKILNSTFINDIRF